MKKLTKILLINWHYIEHQLIEVDSVNFLTGLNGSGKSTIMDAIQFLLLGNPKGNYFNKAANEKAGRTLDGYLKCEVGDDGEAGFKYKRNGRFTSYIATEFVDTDTKKTFTLGVVFDVYKESDTEYNFFIMNSKLPENHFIKEDIPMSKEELKDFLKQNYSKEFVIYNSNRDYQEAMLREAWKYKS